MHHFRSKLFSILIAAFVLAGYSGVLRDVCCHEPAVAAASGPGEASDSHSDSDHGDDAACQCLCHQTYLNEQSAPFETVLLTVLSLVLERADYPPDSVPLGIDYPPQLA